MAKIKLKKQQSKVMQALNNAGAGAVTVTDKMLDKLSDHLEIVCKALKEILYEIRDELIEIGQAGSEALNNIGASIIIGYDKTADLVEWVLGKTFVGLARKLHRIREKIHKHRRTIVKYTMGIVIVVTGMIALFASVTDYQYAYNGRTLGIVKDQQDVLEILDLVSEELTQEYGSSILIDPDTDITFTPVISYGKEIDDADTVLKRFTYMGDIQAQAYGIYADGELLAVVESEKIAKDVLDSITDIYTKKNDETEYEYIGFAEDITIQPYSTTLANVTSKSSALKKIKSGGQQEVSYKVEAGDTLYGICDKLDVSLKELKSMNPGLTETTTLHIGDKFVISQEIPLITVETVEVSTFAESIKYDTEYKESNNYFKGEQVVTRAGKNGKSRVTARLTKQNGKIVEKDVLKEVVIKEPVSKVVVKGTKPVPPKKGTGTLIRPVNVGIYSGYGWRWGRMHYGIDLSAPTGTTIRAADGGTVTYSGWYYGYGYTVMIDHGANVTTLYGHCSALYVSVGDQVYQGQRIAAVGNTGRSTGPHCHFEVKINGANVNPANYV